MNDFLKYYLKGFIFSIRLILLGMFLAMASYPWRFAWDFIAHNFTRHGFGSDSGFLIAEWTVTLIVLPPVLYFVWTIAGETIRGFTKRDSEPDEVVNSE